MKLDDLISKYLDGELSHQEDEQLRLLLSEDDEARDDFDSAVLVHAAMKEDAESITAPDDVVNETEDKIMMSIMNNRDSGVSGFYRRRRYYSYAAVILLFLIGTFYRIYDSYPIDKSGVMADAMNEIRSDLISTEYEFSENEIIMHIPKESYAGRNIDIAANASSGSTIETDKESTADLPAVADLKNNNISMILSKEELRTAENYLPAFTDETGSEDTEIKSESIAITSSIRNNPVSSSYSLSSDHFNNINPAAPRQSLNSLLQTSPQLFDFYTNNSTILLSSFMGTEVVNSGIESNEDLAVSHFSQSIAYAMDNNNSLGVEIGLSKYSYDEVGSISYTVENLEQVNNSSLVESYQYGDLVIQEVVFDKNKELFWASAFYERQMQIGRRFSFNARLALGASSDGPLGYTRIFAKYKLINGIFLTAGAEGRMLYLDIPELINTEPELKKSLMLTYGLQFVL